MKNILILNSGTRNVLIRDFIETINGTCKLVVTDSYTLAPSLYEADVCYVTKRWDDDGYWDEIEAICKKENIGLILSLIDPELELLSAEKKRFEDLGILVCIADEKTIRTTYDKYEALEFIHSHGYKWIKSYIGFKDVEKAINLGEISFPLIAKPRKGSGSAGLEVVQSINRLKEICEEHSDILIQEYIRGKEIGVDIYVDLLSDEVVAIFAKQKLKMRAGETDKSVSVKSEKLFNVISSFAKEFGLKGTNDIDVFEVDGEYYISEINPRFGGGYIHAYASGVNFPKYLINNMNGIPNKPDIGNYRSDIYMMKYFDIKVLEQGELL